MVAMETRGTRKRRWKSSPSKSSRVGLDFEPKTPSPKKPRTGTITPTTRRGTITPTKRSNTSTTEETDSFRIKSFYGKREKTHFPHSPGRRKAVNKVLGKLSDENNDSDSDVPIARLVATKQKNGTVSNNKKQRFDFHSSDSGEAENDLSSRLKAKQQNKTVGRSTKKKVPLKIINNNKTPKSKVNEAVKNIHANTTGKLPSKPSLECDENDPRTPISTGKKFFKSRTPGSGDKCFGSVLIKKGFDIRFVPRRLSVGGSGSIKSEKKEKVVKNKTQTKPVPKVSALKKQVDPDGVFYVSDFDGSTRKQQPIINKENAQHDEIMQDVTTNKLVKSIPPVNNADDSAIDTANSNDLFSSLSGRSDTNKDSKKENQNCENKDEFSDTTSELSSRVTDGVGSEDLFCVSGRTTPITDTPSTSVEGSPGSPNMSVEGSPGSPNMSVEGSPGSPNTSVEGSPGSTVESVGTESFASGPVVSQSAGKKLFSIFTAKRNTISPGTPGSSSQLSHLRTRSSPCGSPLLKYVKSKDNMEQLIIDAGQKKFGVTQCCVCGMIYTLADPADETMHQKFHQSFLSSLRFPGWKKEHVVQHYPETGCRVIMVTSDDPKYAINKVEEINRIMGQELGFPEPNFNFRPTYKAFLLISDDKRVEGCCVTEPVTEGYEVLAVSPDMSSPTSSQRSHPGHRPWCCSDSPVRAVVGISRIWVYGEARRKGVATKLLDCVSQWSAYGSVIPKHLIAFSDPTPDGKILATKYTGRNNFLVYKFNH